MEGKKTLQHCYLLQLSRDGDKMAPSVEKKIAELEMGLLHLQQNIEIPEISLLIHPIITNIAKQCYERGEKPKVTDFGDKVEDPTFLNQLQSGVNRWIREIQKVRGISIYLSQFKSPRWKYITKQNQSLEKNLSNKKHLIYGCYHHCSRPSR